MYTAIGINLEGQKSVLDLWANGNEGAKYWMAVLQNLKNRGMKDAFVICTDGLKGFPEAALAEFRRKYPKHQVVADVWERNLANSRLHKILTLPFS